MIVMIVKISVVLHGGWILWNVAPFRILDEFDVFMDMVLAAFEVVIPLYL